MGMSNVRKTGRTTKPKKGEEIPQPTLTPRQRLVQQLWMQDTIPRGPSKVRLPQGGENALVPAAKRPRTATEPGYRSEPVVVSVEVDRMLQEAREFASVELLSPMSSNHSEKGVEDGVQGRGEMAEPTPTEQARASVPSSREPASRHVPTTVTVTADVHVPFLAVQEQPGNSRQLETPSEVRRKVTIISDVRVPTCTVREQPGGSRQDAITAVGDSEDDEEIHSPRNSSQEEFDGKVAVMAQQMTQLKSQCRDKIEASDKNIALIHKEEAELKTQMEHIKKRLRFLYKQRHEEERCKENWSGRLAALKTIFQE